jgi:hypothetical protein
MLPLLLLQALPSLLLAVSPLAVLLIALPLQVLPASLSRPHRLLR